MVIPSQAPNTAILVKGPNLRHRSSNSPRRESFERCRAYGAVPMAEICFSARTVSEPCHTRGSWGPSDRLNQESRQGLSGIYVSRKCHRGLDWRQRGGHSASCAKGWYRCTGAAQDISRLCGRDTVNSIRYTARAMLHMIMAKRDLCLKPWAVYAFSKCKVPCHEKVLVEKACSRVTRGKSGFSSSRRRRSDLL